jgi:hypothetical protein
LQSFDCSTNGASLLLKELTRLTLIGETGGRGEWGRRRFLLSSAPRLLRGGIFFLSVLVFLFISSIIFEIKKTKKNHQSDSVNLVSFNKL